MRKIRKSLLAVMLALFCVLGLSSCGVENENYEEYKPTQGSMFTCVESYYDPYLGKVKILVDKQTRIMYLYYYDEGSDCNFSTNLTVLYDSDGKPKKYNGVITD